MIEPCDQVGVSVLAKPDGLVLLNPAPGAINTASAVDPAWLGASRSEASLDMFASANGFDPKTGAARYKPVFLKRFYAAQSARNRSILADAKAWEGTVAAGKGAFSDD